MMHNKVSYLLNRFKNTEWSGPAWYNITKTKDNGFPEKVELVYFKPIHLGHGTETEIDGEKLGKLLPKLYKKFPDLKSCYLGLIHSHHTMGAFLSGTDKDTAREQATSDGFFFSTVVASQKDPYACCFTYADRYGYTNLIDGEVKVDMPKVKVPKEWVAEATAIKKAKDKEPKITYFNNSNQLSLVNTRGNTSRFGSVYDGVGYTPIEEALKDDKDADDAKKKYSSWDQETELSQEEFDKMQELSHKYCDGEMTYHEFIEEVRKECPNTNPYTFMDGMGGNSRYW